MHVRTITYKATSEEYISISDLILLLVESRENYEPNSEAYELLQSMIETFLELNQNSRACGWKK